MGLDLFRLKYPPPWKAWHWGPDNNGPERGLWCVVSDRGDPAEEFDVFEDPDEATARLSAGAPALFAACKALTDWLDAPASYSSHAEAQRQLHDKHQAIRAALAAIEGEG